jgi:hypothetical protein
MVGNDGFCFESWGIGAGRSVCDEHSVESAIAGGASRAVYAILSFHARNNVMTSEPTFEVATQAHLNRMAATERQYEVWARKADCWDASAKKIARPLPGFATFG